MFLGHLIGVLIARTDFPTGFGEKLVDELETGFLLTEVEGGGGLLCLVKQGGFLGLGGAGGFGLGAGFFEIGEEFRKEGFLLGELLEGGLLFPLDLGFRITI